jgi:hypothetical protein
MIGLFSTAARTAVATWGGGGTTLAFGVVPAVGLTVAMFRRDWCECWRHAAREIA